MKKLVIGLILIGLCCVPLAAAENETAPKTGSAAPGLTLPTLDGKTVSLQDFRGRKKVVLTFFASWSKTCQDELRTLAELRADRQTNCEVLAVSFDNKTRDLKNFLARSPLPFPVLNDRKLSSIDAFQVLIIPTTFCIGRDGVIEQIFVDYDDNVKKAVAEWLGS
ncbi:MAG TPA: TlpA disulfide reductase family protein [Candidatus Sulfotelmatobacter sp.]|nr:TlpA disulfide reductase family protein [Candidatus Sulfotelmatobacter sp.]